MFCNFCWFLLKKLFIQSPAEQYDCWFLNRFVVMAPAFVLKIFLCPLLKGLVQCFSSSKQVFSANPEKILAQILLVVLEKNETMGFRSLKLSFNLLIV